MLGFGGWRRQEQRSRARDRAVWLIRDHGDDAEAVLEAEIARGGHSVTKRARMRLVRAALRRERRRRAASSMRKPMLAGLAAAFGIRLRGQRSSPRRSR